MYYEEMFELLLNFWKRMICMETMYKLTEVFINKYDLYVNRPRIRLFHQNRIWVLTKVYFLTEFMYPVQDSLKSVFPF